MKTLIASANLQRLLGATILGVLAIGGSAMCLASDKSDLPQTVVKFADLNLSSPDSAAELYSRIAAAADEVCKSFDRDSRDLLDLIEREDCVHSAVRMAVAKVNQPALSAIYRARYNEPLPMSLATARNH